MTRGGQGRKQRLAIVLSVVAAMGLGGCGSTPSGRLHRALVKKGLANYTWGFERALHDPGFASFGAGLPKDASVEAARDALLAELEGIGRHPVRAAEGRRAKTELLNDFDNAQRNTRSLVQALSEFAAIGDWRLFYLYRDRLRADLVGQLEELIGLVTDLVDLARDEEPVAQWQEVRLDELAGARAVAQGLHVLC